MDTKELRDLVRVKDGNSRIEIAVSALRPIADEIDRLRAILGEIRPLAAEDGIERDLTADEALARIRALVRGVDTDSPVVPKQTLDESQAECERLRAALKDARGAAMRTTTDEQGRIHRDLWSDVATRAEADVAAARPLVEAARAFREADGEAEAQTALDQMMAAVDNLDAAPGMP